MVILLGKDCCHRAQVYTDTWRPRRPPKKNLCFPSYLKIFFSLSLVCRHFFSITNLVVILYGDGGWWFGH